MAKPNKPKGMSKKGAKGSGSSGSSLPMSIIAAVIACVLGGYYFSGAALGGTSPYTKPFSLGKILDLKKGITPSTKKFVKSGSVMWKDAREAMMKNPKATLIHADPDVFLIDDLLSHEECDTMLDLFEQRKASAIDPKWCFAPAKYGDLSSQGAVKNLDGDYCFEPNTPDGPALAKLHGRAVSRSIMVTRKEAEIADLVGRRVEEQAGLDEDHAFHTQLLEYSQSELYEAHTDCSGSANDRAGTSLIYLTDVEGGGETGFPELGISVKPKKGMGLFFGSLDKYGKCNQMTKHVGAQVTKGEKRVLQRWYYNNFLVPAGDTDSVLCDIGNNCRHYMYNQTRVKGYKLGQKGGELKANGKMEEAEKTLKEALTYWPWDPMTNAFLGEVLKAKGDKKGSIKHFTAAVEIAGKFPDPYWFLGEFNLQDKKFDEAEHNFRKVVASTPKDQDGWYFLAQALQGQSRNKEALKAVMTHLRINPGDQDGVQLRQAIQASL
jgi:tetratricopeptide (TPR) repeat protein